MWRSLKSGEINFDANKIEFCAADVSEPEGGSRDRDHDHNHQAGQQPKQQSLRAGHSSAGP